MTEIRFVVTGMTCGHCARTVERAAATVAGVRGAQVDLERNTLTAQTDPHVTPEDVVAAVAATGYGIRRSS